jgi:hypothetical protein
MALLPHNDTIELIKADGTTYPNLKASVQAGQIFMDASELDGKGIDVEPNDTITRELPNGTKESYRVANPGYWGAGGLLPASYQMVVVRQ